MDDNHPRVAIIAAMVIGGLMFALFFMAGRLSIQRSEYKYISDHCISMGGFIMPDGTVFNCQPRTDLLQLKKDAKK